MPASVRVTHKDQVCVFREEGHTYNCFKLGVPDPAPGSPDEHFGMLMSVTTLVHQFLPPFDEAKQAEETARKRGCDVESLIMEWAEKRERACRLGTRTHETAEDCLLGRSPRNAPEDDAERARFKAVWNYAKGQVYDKMKVEGVEKLVFSSALGIAGSIDLLAMRDAKHYILDWKTNENLMRPAFGTFLAPFTHLQADSLTIYSLQLSIYRILLEVEGYVQGGFGDPFALWVHPKDGADGAFCVDPVRLRDLRTEGALMIALRFQTPWYEKYLKSAPF